jgi:hypothetical protein
MSAKNPETNVTINADQLGLLSDLAVRNEKSLSAIVNELIEEALELREDIYFSKLAAERDTPESVWVSHEDAWK